MKYYSLVIAIVLGLGLWVSSCDSAGDKPLTVDSESPDYWMNKAYEQVDKVADDKKLALIERLIYPYSHVSIPIPLAIKIIDKYQKTYGDRLTSQLAMFQARQGDFDKAILTANSLSDESRQGEHFGIAISMCMDPKNATLALKQAAGSY